MLRKIFGVTLIAFLLMLAVLPAVSAAAAPRPVGETVDRNGVHYTVYEETKADGKLYRYYVEDGALDGSGGSLKFYARQSGMESAAFVAAALLFSASLLAVYRRGTMQGLLHA